MQQFMLIIFELIDLQNAQFEKFNIAHNVGLNTVRFHRYNQTIEPSPKTKL